MKKAFLQPKSLVMYGNSKICGLRATNGYPRSRSGSRSRVDVIMEALTDANIYKIGVYLRIDDKIMASLLEIVKRRVTRDSLFGVTVIVSINKLVSQVTEHFPQPKLYMDSTTINQEEIKKTLDELRFQSSDLLGHAENYAHGGAREVSESKTLALKDIMEALTDPNIYMIGLCGKDDIGMADLLERVHRRVTRDKLFGVTVVVSIRKNPNLTRIQHEIADELGFKFEEQGKEDKTAFCRWVLSDGKTKVVNENARQLYDGIMKEPSVVFILLDLQEGLDLDKVGIPFGAAHPGCKLILTSESEEVLSNHMNAQRTIRF